MIVSLDFYHRCKLIIFIQSIKLAALENGKITGLRGRSPFKFSKVFILVLQKFQWLDVILLFAGPILCCCPFSLLIPYESPEYVSDLI